MSFDGLLPEIKTLCEKYSHPAIPNVETTCKGQELHQARRIVIKKELDELADKYNVPREQCFPSLRRYLELQKEFEIDYLDRKLICRNLIEGCNDFARLAATYALRQEFSAMQAMFFPELDANRTFQDILDDKD